MASRECPGSDVFMLRFDVYSTAYGPITRIDRDIKNFLYEVDDFFYFVVNNLAEVLTLKQTLHT